MAMMVRADGDCGSNSRDCGVESEDERESELRARARVGVSTW